MEIDYLADNSEPNREREHEILERFDQFLGNIAPFLVSLGIAPNSSWYLIENQMEQLVPGIKGDVDVLAGAFEPASPELLKESLDKIKKLDSKMPPARLDRLAEIDVASKGGLKWVPSLDYLVGIEVKCCYLPPDVPKISEKEMKSRKSSDRKVERIRNEVDKLLNLGFDKVGLFEFVINPPADGIGNEPWNVSARTVGQSLDAMRDIFSRRLPADSPAGHGACSFGGVCGREEHHSGVDEHPIFRQAQANHRLAQNENVKANRRTMAQNLELILEQIPKPRTMPAVFVRDRKTGELNFINEGVISG